MANKAKANAATTREIPIHEVVQIAKRVHDTEHVNLGAASTRESRNAFWARAIGIVHHGHPGYNPTGDPRWHIKSAGGGRPQSDDVVVLMPGRIGYDCIPNAGADTYYFNDHPHGEVLGPEQEVYAPPVPAGTGGAPAPTPPTPKPPPAPPLKNRIVFADELRQVNEFYASRDGLQRVGGMVTGAGAWAFEILNAYAKGDAVDHQQLRAACAEVLRLQADILALTQWGYDLMTGAKVDDVINAIRGSLEWKQKHPLG